MSFTADNVVDLAVLRSQMNDKNLIDNTLLYKAMGLYQKRAYTRAALVNPEYFGTSGDTATRSTYTAAWDLDSAPTNVAAVTKAVVKTIVGTVTGVAVGDQVNLVMSRFPEAEIAPRAYVRGREIFGYGNELGAADANMVTKLTVYYAALPASPTSAASVMSIPDEWIDLVVLPVAILMCLRDRRPEDAQAIDAELKEVYDLFQASVASFDHGASRPLPSIPPLPAAPAGK